MADAIEPSDAAAEAPRPAWVIASLAATQRDAGRVSVKLRDPAKPNRKPKFLAAIADASRDTLGLQIGMPVTPALEARILEDADRDKALKSALARIGRRDMSAGMLRQRLRKAGYADPDIDHALAWLDERGLIDEAAFADAVIREATRGKPAGEVLLRQKLREKFISDDAIAAALIRNRPERDALQDAADTFARQQARQMHRLAPDVRRRRLYGRLARRGFSPDVVRAAMEAADADAAGAAGDAEPI